MCGDILAAPGNPGIAAAGPHRADRPDRSLRPPASLAEREQIDFTVVGPELPLEPGNRRSVSPTTAACCSDRPPRPRASESSKAFAKAFMARHQHSQPRGSESASRRRSARVVRREEFDLPVVLKADGLAAGKGVVDRRGSRGRRSRAIGEAMRDRRFGAAGDRLVIEESPRRARRSRSSRSATARTRSPSASAQDHKRVFDDDRGPNTGGMGAFAPEPIDGCRARSAGHAGDRRAGDRRDGRRRSSVPRISLRRADADGGRPEGDRVQCPARRSGDAGASCRSSTSRCCRCWSLAQTVRFARSPSGSGHGVVSPASFSRHAAIRSRPNPGSRDRRHRRGGGDSGVAVYHAGTAQRGGHTSSPPAGAC